eukprot:m.111729 g.111729  ORF g.111729 m.111729 type:complete len:213 (-) comp15957_c1_seq4:1851-2489(-)
MYRLSSSVITAGAAARACTGGCRPSLNAAAARRMMQTYSAVLKQQLPTQGGQAGPRTLMEGKPFSELTLAEKVTETSKDVGSFGVVAFGIGVGVMFLLATAKELLFAETPDSVFKAVLARVEKEEKIRELLGVDIQGPDFSQVRASTYTDGNNVYLRMEFTISGTYSRGKVMLEMKKKKDGMFEKYTPRYLLVDTVGGVSQRVILEDNREKQ